ncbi:MAG: PAS domain S-box protein, partial [Salibacteraceae bacterium]
LNSFLLNGKLMFQAVVRDVTKKKSDEQKITEQQKNLNEAYTHLKSKTNFLEIVNQFAKSVQSIVSAHDLVAEIMDVLLNKFHFPDCVVYLYDEKNNLLNQIQPNVLDEKKIKPQNSSFVLNMNQGIVGAAAKSLSTIRIGDTSKDDRYVPDGIFRYSELAIPMVVNGKLLGVIDTEHPEKNYFTDDHENVVSTLAGISATRFFMINSEKALQESEQKHRLIFENAKDAIILIKQGLFFDCNEMTLKMFGCKKKSEILGQSPYNWSPDFQYNGESSVKLATQKIDQAVSGMPLTFPWVHKKKNGELFDAEVSLNSFILNGEQYVQAMVRDVTERKALTQSLIKSESLYRNLIETTGTVAWELDLKTKKYTYIGNISEKLTGYKPNKWKTLNDWLRIIHTDQKESVLAGYNHFDFNTSNRIIEYRIIKADNNVAWVRDVATLVYENNNPVSLQGYFIDITTEKEIAFVKEDFTQKLKEKVDELLVSRENYKHLFDDSLVALMEQDLSLPYAVLQELKAEKVSDIKSYLEENPSVINKCLNGIETIHVNKVLKNLVGAPSVKYVEENLSQFFSEETIPMFISILEALYKGDKEFFQESSLRDYHGNKVHGLIKLYFKVQEDSKRLTSIVSIVNITERVNAELELSSQNQKLIEVSNNLSIKNVLLDSSKRRFEELFEHTPVSLWEEDLGEVIKLIQSKRDVGDFKEYLNNNPHFVEECIKKINIVNVNLSSLELFGVKSKPQLKQHLKTTFNQNSYQILKNELISIANGNRKFTSETEFVNLNGSIIHAILTLEIIDDKGMAIVSIVDVTDIKKAKLASVLAREKAEESDRLKTEFLNNISHEIRTPLNGIIGFSKLLSDNKITSELRNQYAGTIQNSGHQLIRIIDEILEISKLNKKEDRIKLSKVSLQNVLFDLSSIFTLIGDEKGVKLVMNNYIENKNNYVLTDETKLNKILNNILQNAFKFTQNGNVECTCEIENNFIKFTITDTGIGINKDKLNRIFERFAQEDLTIASNFGGLGLGLSIVKEHVELLGGEIMVKSEKNQGSTFTVKIPYKPAKMEKKQTVELKTAESYPENKVVLLVEDDAVNAMLMERYLENSKMFSKVIHAFNGQEAIDICRDNSNINLVLMDIGIPIKNGYIATQEIKSFRPSLPIIAQTAYTNKEDRTRVFDAGCDDMIAKPIDYSELLQLVKSYIVAKG